MEKKHEHLNYGLKSTHMHARYKLKYFLTRIKIFFLFS